MVSKRNRRSRKSKGLWLKIVGVVALAAVGVVTWQQIESRTRTRGRSVPDIQTMDTRGTTPQVMTPQSVESQVIEYPGFTVSFNKEHHQPNWVAWELTADEVTTNAIGKRRNNFAPDTSVDGCATLDDYRNSGYDRGHMAPAGDMKWSEVSADACFLLTNMSPQDKSLNGKAWRVLEEKCRDWAVRDSAIWIVCGPVLTDKITKRIGRSGVSVPERYFKVVVAPYANPPRGIAFIMPNTDVPGGIQRTATTIDEVERITGLDFFTNLPDDVEANVEAECNFPRWSRR